MSESRIGLRMKDHFGRYVAWLEEVLGELETVGAGLGGDALDVLEAMELRHRKGSVTLEDEFWALKAEWDDTAEVPEADEAGVKELARRVSALCDDVKRVREEVSVEIGHRLEVVRSSIDEVARGRAMVQKYGGQGEEGSMVDRKA